MSELKHSTMFDGTYPTPVPIIQADENGRAETIDMDFDKEIFPSITQMSPCKDFVYTRDDINGGAFVQFEGRHLAYINRNMLSLSYSRNLNNKEFAAIVYGYMIYFSECFPMMLDSGENLWNLWQMLDSIMAGSTMDEFA